MSSVDQALHTDTFGFSQLIDDITREERWVVNRLPWQEPPRLQLLGSLSPAAPREPTPLLRLLRRHSPTAPEEPTPLGPENFGGGIG